MRTVNMVIGALFMIAGIVMIAGFSGITFLSVAFVLGILFMLAGIFGCLSYRSYREDSVDKTWVLVDGMTTFVLGFLIISNRLASDAAVPLVLGLWVAVTGLRNLVRAWEKIEARDSYFYGHLSIGLLNVIVGFYMYFNNDMFALPVGVLVGMCVLTHGLNVFMVAVTILIEKSEFLMTKEEMLARANEEMEKAHEAAKEAIKVFKEARTTAEVIEQTPEEELDAALAPKPEVPPVEESSEDTAAGGEETEKNE
ncbi:MAG: DUF308 domain-containing protein, partial [Anaerovoracaceae bacterium]|nr:DUF308 domain-containing protein [Anaerovoracaceae bacterium]